MYGQVLAKKLAKRSKISKLNSLKKQATVSTTSTEIVNVVSSPLTTTNTLINGVFRNNSTQVRNYSNASASVDSTKLIDAASRGDLATVKSMVEKGVNINQGDYDHRTPLHLAASEGHLQVVQYLLEKGAEINAVDRFGGTPYKDAVRGGKSEVAAFLKSTGGIQELTIGQLRKAPEFRSAVNQSLPLLCDRSKFDYVEVWVPSDVNGTTIDSKDWYASKQAVGAFSAFRKLADNVNAPKDGLVAQAVKSKQPRWLPSVGKAEVSDRHTAALGAGIKSGLVLPLTRDDSILAVYVFFSRQERRDAPSHEELQALSGLASGMLIAGLFPNEDPTFPHVPGVPGGQMAVVYRQILNEGVFNAQVVYEEVDYFYKLGLQQYYWEHYAPADIAAHIHSYIAAKKLAQTSGRAEEITYSTEEPNGAGGFYLCNNDHKNVEATEARIVKMIEKLQPTQAYSLFQFISDGPIVSGGTKKLAISIFSTPKFPDTPVTSSEKDIWKVATSVFLRKPAPMRERYQEIINESVGKLAPTFKIYPTYRDGTIPVMMCFKRGDGSSYLTKITELLQYHKLRCKRKFIETFSNGLVVYSLYIFPSPIEQIQRLLNQISLTAFVPRSELTELFLSGELGAEEYAYASSSMYFTYYFSNQKSEEFGVLAQSLKGDPINLGRLKTLQTKMKRELVSQRRIIECLVKHTNVLKDIYKNFETICKGGKSSAEEQKAIKAAITKAITHPVDGLILNSLLAFNDSVLKTNFYAPVKSCLSFRLNPEFLRGSEIVPDVPFGLFLLVGYEFHGFHLRFADIARGGIRMIRSANDQVYQTNFETVFMENYGLAHTQNRKNKDIPEFGSKGTILLNRANQNNAELAFQKYVAGLLDLLVPKEGVFNRYGKEEILFLGPDEGTADYMAWAALYAKDRGYQYWKSFTTGKPPAIGGIPHDLFGMTTRSVHAYVLGCLRKAGLKEEEVTKFQTGGPDGDLGSNEILISKDKTIAIVDGSGVAYDPNGLNRPELVRLATNRSMIKEFDRSKLSKGGFVVLIGDRDVTLPNGETVESGLTFRNEFHLHPLSQADLFVPCGGRPEAINLSNVSKVIDDKGKPKWKYIVEGANLFITNDARMVVEKAGAILYKDASANKGGVTSSSMEVLAALALNDAEFQKHMIVTAKDIKDSAAYPPFYKAYVEEIQQRIFNLAELEFECIWKEAELTGKPRYLLSDEVSNKINDINNAIQASSLWNNEALKKKVLSEAIPKQLVNLLGVDTLMKRVPDQYLKAIFGAYLASHFIYTYGMSGGEFAFFSFMQSYLKK